MRSFFANCADCGARRKVRRHELDRAKQPRCLRCGGPLGLSQAARQNLATVHDAQRGEPAPQRRARAEPEPQRIIPVRETKRYDFWEHPDMYRWALYDLERKGHRNQRDAVRAAGPVRFYTERGLPAISPDDPDRFAVEAINLCEQELYRSGRPYYKVWPSIASALCHTEMRIDGEFFRTPYDGIEIRLPKADNPLLPACALIAARMQGNLWSDGRDWSFVVVWFSNVPEFWSKDDAGHYWIADIPVRRGLSLEDALDQTALVRQCPDPELARRLVRVAVGVCFFGLDNHEVILPDLPRRVVERYQSERRQPTASEAAKELKRAKELGLFGYRVGSEIDLPSAVVERRLPEEDTSEHRELTCGHIRRGHLRLQPCGEGRRERRLIFLPPTLVRPDLPLQSAHGYRVRIT